MIAGPTASGKTKISIELAKLINGEIISADSMQVYKYMDIGTAKPSQEEREGVEHFLIDEVCPDEDFSVVRFQELAIEYIDKVLNKGKIPIVVGGTGLYINSLKYNLKFSENETNWDLREKLNNIAVEKGNKFLHDQLRNIDPESADRIHENNVKRIIRAIEVFETTKQTITHHQEISRLEPPKYDYILYGLFMERQSLYERINRRVDDMLENGLVNEVKGLLDKGYHEDLVSMQGLGYKEIVWYLDGKVTYDEAIYLLKRNTRRFAKRQITWFKKVEGIKWIEANENCVENNIIKDNINFL